MCLSYPAELPRDIAIGSIKVEKFGNKHKSNTVEPRYNKLIGTIWLTVYSWPHNLTFVLNIVKHAVNTQLSFPAHIFDTLKSVTVFCAIGTSAEFQEINQDLVEHSPFGRCEGYTWVHTPTGSAADYSDYSHVYASWGRAIRATKRLLRFHLDPRVIIYMLWIAD